jgi:hypothetical protein
MAARRPRSASIYLDWAPQPQPLQAQGGGQSQGEQRHSRVGAALQAQAAAAGVLFAQGQALVFGFGVFMLASRFSGHSCVPR